MAGISCARSQISSGFDDPICIGKIDDYLLSFWSAGDTSAVVEARTRSGSTPQIACVLKAQEDITRQGYCSSSRPRARIVYIDSMKTMSQNATDGKKIKTTSRRGILMPR